MAEYDRSRQLQILKLTQPITLYYLDEMSTKALITEPLRDMMSIDDDAVKYLSLVTAGHPYLIQFVLKKAFDTAQRVGRRCITSSDIRGIEKNMITEGPAYEGNFGVLDSDYSVDEILSEATESRGRGLLSLIAKLGNRNGWVTHETIRSSMSERGGNESTTDSLLNQLFHARILAERKQGERLCFKMVIPLLRKRYQKQNFFLKHFRDAKY